jgi:FAD/FMN-containing dehydrogenase
VEENASFAIKSGGHGMYMGASNVEGGVTIDLARLNSFELSENGKSAKIGAGAKWGEVYAILDPLGLTVSGGRVSSVGVTGFLLGGKLNFWCGYEVWE